MGMSIPPKNPQERPLQPPPVCPTLSPPPNHNFPADSERTLSPVKPPPAPKTIPSLASAGAVQPAVVATGRQEAGARELELRERLERFLPRLLEYAPPWLASMIFHMVMFIIMALIFYVRLPSDRLHLDAELVYAEKLGEQLESDSPLGDPDVKITAEQPAVTPLNLPAVAEPLAAPGALEIQPEGRLAGSSVEAPQIGMALTGREEGSARRKGLLDRYGGTATTEAAVQKGLRWLANNQQSNGSWSLAGPYSNGVIREMDNPAAATAMALLAFQGAGNTHRNGKYHRNVAQAWRWLLRQQDRNGNFFQLGGFNHRFYTQGLCTIALCELYGMTKDPDYKEPAQRAVNYCLRSQSPEGGWRYTPNSDSDVSVTGWVVMGLQSARMAGLHVPTDNLRRVEEFLDSVAQYDGARYPYQQGDEVRLSMTAEALLMRQYLGWRRDDPRLVAGVEWITDKENLIDFRRNRNVYYWYYATQVAHHMEGDYWKRWNAVMREELPKQQVARGKEAGSWDPDNPTRDQWASQGGRLYVTCLSIYMLEVYYRYLPIYLKVYTQAPQQLFEELTPAAPRGEQSEPKPPATE